MQYTVYAAGLWLYFSQILHNAVQYNAVLAVTLFWGQCGEMHLPAIEKYVLVQFNAISLSRCNKYNKCK